MASWGPNHIVQGFIPHFIWTFATRSFSDQDGPRFLHDFASHSIIFYPYQSHLQIIQPFGRYETELQRCLAVHLASSMPSMRCDGMPSSCASAAGRPPENHGLGVKIQHGEPLAASYGWPPAIPRMMLCSWEPSMAVLSF